METLPDKLVTSSFSAILPYPDRYPRNRFSIVLYPVLLGGAKTALHRLTQVFADSKSLATSPDVLSNYYIVYLLGLLPAPLLNVLAPLAHATFTFSKFLLLLLLFTKRRIQ